MRYYKLKWNESRGDEYDHWGHSIWYLEIGEDDYINRQIEIYDNGRVLKYSEEYVEDEYGGLGDQKFDFEEYNSNEFNGREISKEEFEKFWLTQDL